MEKSLQNTLLVAQTTAEEIFANARKKADMIIKGQRNKVKRLLKIQITIVVKINKNYEELKKRYRF